MSAPPPPPARRRRARPFFLAALLLAALAVFALPAPFAGFAALACVGAFLAGCVQALRNADPELVHNADRGGMGGWF